MAHELKSGDEFGRYEIKHLLGRGGMSDVYLAYDPMLDREVAVKVLPPEFSRNEERARRFAKEVRAVAALNHPNIVTIYQVGEQDGCQFCTMALLPGGDLRKRLKKGLKTSEALKIAAQVATALGHAHQRGLIHRDIKPGNIMFDESGNAIVVDFGIAKVLDSDTHLTGTGKSIGTPHYMSPEQAQGMSTIDGRSDVYSLGIVLYEMLTGKVPFDADNTIGIAFKHVQEEAPPLPRELNEFQPLMDRMLSKQPENRFDTAEDAAAEIAAQRATVPGGITKTSMIERRRTPTPRAAPAFRTETNRTTQRRAAKKKASKKQPPRTKPQRSLPTTPAPAVTDDKRQSTAEQLAARPAARYTLPVLISIASLIAIAVVGHMMWQYFGDEERPAADSTQSEANNQPELLTPDSPGNDTADSPRQAPIDEAVIETPPDPEAKRLEQVRELAASRIREAEEALREADTAEATRYAPGAYNRASSLLNDARAALLQSADPDSSAELALQAREEAAMAEGMAAVARETELQLQERLPEAQAAIDAAVRAGAEDYARDQLERARAGLADAEAALARLDFAAAEQNLNSVLRRAEDAASIARTVASSPASDTPADTSPDTVPDTDSETIAQASDDTNTPDQPSDRPGESAADQAETPSEPRQPTINERIVALLQAAEADIQALRLTRPADDNAMEKINRVLSLDPDNQQARQAVDRVARLYVDLARDSLAEGNWDEARARASQARSLAPDLPGIPALVSEIEEAEANAGPASGQTLRDALASGGQGPELIVLPAGNFVMGSGAGADYERPATPVSIRQPVAMGRLEVTVGEFRRFVDSSGYRTLAERGEGCIQWLFGWRRSQDADWRNPGFDQNDDHPVTCVSYDDALAYTEWLSEQTGQSYRLPSEAEWEYAARAGGSALTYWQGDAGGACQSANISDLTRADDHGLERTSDNVFMCRDGAIQTDVAGSHQANAFGLWDMLGNLEEWTLDCWNPNHRGAGNNGRPRTDGDCAQAVVRGGSWHTLPGLVRVSYRAGAERSARITTTGFRVLREIAR